MSTFVENTHVFILRIWLEPREIEGAVPQFRAVIEHVSSGEQRYLGDLDEIVQVISGYVPEPRSGIESQN